MPSKRAWFGIAAALLAAAGIAVAATKESGYSAAVVFKKSSGSDSGAKGTGTFSGKLTKKTRSLLTGYAAAANIPLSDMAKGGRYAVSYTLKTGRFAGTVYVKFKSAAAGSVCLRYSGVPTQFADDFGMVPAHGTFKTSGGTGKGAKTIVSGTWTVPKKAFAGTKETDTVTGNIKTASAKAKPLNATCKKLAKTAR